MTIRKFKIDDFEEVVNMFYALTAEIYPSRAKGAKYFFYRSVIDWVSSDKDIVVVEKDNQLVGFTLAYLDQCGGITEPIYNGEIAYVKPIARKTKAAYMLYHNVSNYAKEQGVTLIANAYIGGENNVDKIQKKLGGQPMFVSMERSK